jgi:predicted DsbA family dithiol-disulfide isomerase
MTVLHWYDFICPFCYVGQDRNSILVRHGISVVEMPFQAHPEIPAGGIVVGPRRGSMYRMLEHDAAAAGLPLRWPTRLPNTRRALAVAEWTRNHDAQAFVRLHKQLFAAHFALGEDLGDPELIDRYARSCGIDLGALHAALADGSAELAVSSAEALGRQHGVQGTPAWLLPQGMINGLRPAAEFEHIAAQAAAPTRTGATS